MISVWSLASDRLQSNWMTWTEHTRHKLNFEIWDLTKPVICGVDREMSSAPFEDCKTHFSCLRATSDDLARASTLQRRWLLEFEIRNLAIDLRSCRLWDLKSEI